jgi:hypothetical protein
MPLFDESHLPPGVPEEVMHGVNTVIAGLRGRLVKEIVLPEGPLRLRVPTQVLRELFDERARRPGYGGRRAVAVRRPRVQIAITRPPSDQPDACYRWNVRHGMQSCGPAVLRCARLASPGGSRLSAARSMRRCPFGEVFESHRLE